MEKGWLKESNIRKLMGRGLVGKESLGEMGFWVGLRKDFRVGLSKDFGLVCGRILGWSDEGFLVGLRKKFGLI